MNILETALFTMGKFEVTLTILILVLVVIIVLVAIVAYRYNHRKQAKASQYMDNECLIYNKKGLEKYLQRKKKKFSNPTVMVVEMRNLSYLYMNYSKRSKLMYDITDCLTKGLSKYEVISRIEFDKFFLILDNKEKEDIRSMCQSMERRLVEMQIEDFGMYDFYLYFGVYEKAPLEDPEIIYVSSAIIPFSKLIENNIYYYTDDVRVIFEKLKKINNEKQPDFEQNKFVPYIQPNVDLRTGKVVGGEILCRWEDEQTGFKFNPGDFIPLFEQTGFIRYIDELMLKSACELAQRMIHRGRTDIIISVNVSKVQFLTPNFESRVMEIVQSYQIDPKNIMLEISENTLMENYASISKIITKLRQFGFTVAMDDFGKELSSMESLTTGSFEYVKLDMLFFKNKLATEKDRVIVKNILRMLLNLNYKLICEGVSDEKTLTELARICREVIVQGYVISEPIPLPLFDPFADRIFNFDLPEYEEEEEAKPKKKKAKDEEDKDSTIAVDVNAATTPNGGTSINISGLGGTTVVPEQNKEIEEMRRQMEEMRHQFQSTLEEQKRQAHEDEMKRMREEMARMQNQPKENNSEIEALRLEIERLKANQNTANTTYIQREYRDRGGYYDYEDEISRLRREVSDLRYSSNRDRYYVKDNYYVKDSRDREFELLQKQIDDLKETQKNQPVFNIDELVERLTKRQDDSRYRIEKAEAEAKSLRERLEQERKEREDLEALIAELQSKQAEEEEIVEVDEAEQVREQEEADRNLNLDLSTLSRTNVADDEDEEEDDEEEIEKLAKPKLSLEELEAIIQSYRDKYNEDWSTHAKNELKDGYYEIIDGLNYYKRTRRTFLGRIKKASPELKQVFNIVKNEIMKYSSVSNKLTNFYDSFYLGRKLICKLSLTSKKLKVYLAVDPAKYPERQFPHKDVSEKKAHARTPYYTMVRSQLSVRRINKVITDLMEEQKVLINPNYKVVDYANKFKYMKDTK